VIASNLIATLGTFDGLHTGHQLIAHEVIKEASENGGIPMLLSFYPHPASVVAKRDGGYLRVPRLCRPRQFTSIVKKLGISRVELCHFTQALSCLSGEEFIRNIILNRYGIDRLIVGEDAGIGRARSMSAKALVSAMQRFGKSGRIVSSLCDNGEKIGSRLIRSAIEGGEVEQVSHLLGRPYSILGRVVAGSGRGKVIGIPTANVGDIRQLLPKIGVYGGVAMVDGCAYRAMINIGVRPTFFENNPNVVVEAHLLQYSGKEQYGSRIEVWFTHRLRMEKKFNSIADLTKQILLDKEIVSNLSISIPKCIKFAVE
jgi:riboflavin kinase/FMN adenylyltransferase